MCVQLITVAILAQGKLFARLNSYYNNSRYVSHTHLLGDITDCWLKYSRAEVRAAAVRSLGEMVVEERAGREFTIGLIASLLERERSRLFFFYVMLPNCFSIRAQPLLRHGSYCEDDTLEGAVRDATAAHRIPRAPRRQKKKFKIEGTE